MGDTLKRSGQQRTCTDDRSHLVLRVQSSSKGRGFGWDGVHLSKPPNISNAYVFNFKLHCLFNVQRGPSLAEIPHSLST
jgi:hypothetical protein